MPLYEFLCPVCQRQLQQFFATFDEAGKAPIPTCCDKLMNKQIGEAMFILKGKDWPSRDFRRQTERYKRG